MITRKLQVKITLDESDQKRVFSGNVTLEFFTAGIELLKLRAQTQGDVIKLIDYQL